MKELRIGMAMVMAFLLALFPGVSSADRATATASVSATVSSVTSITITRDMNSVPRGSATIVLFDKRDDQDPGAPAPKEPFSMYAPYRSETGKNWHVTRIAANRSNTALSISVTGTIGTTPLASILEVWCAGFFPDGGTLIPGTPDTRWVFANGWSRSVARAFMGVVPFSYRINIAGVTAGGPYTGTITFTVTST